MQEANVPLTTPPKTSGLAVTSLVTGILGLLICGLGLVSVIFGHVALSKIKRSGGALKGGGLAIAGLVLGYLSLILTIVMLPIAVKAYKKGSDRAGCILNQRNVQQAVRSHQGMKNLQPGDPIDWKELIGPGKFLEKEPTCPGHGKYTFSTTVPEVGVLAVECSHAGEPDKHVHADYSNW